MFLITEITAALTRTTVATAETFEAAKALVPTFGAVVMLEDDADHPGCADAFLVNGRILSVEPARA